MQDIAKQLTARNKGILAADESFPTIEKRFKKINIESTEETRRDYRQMLFTTPKIEEFISGVILFDETIRQSTDQGKRFVDFLNERGIIPGIKVDQGTEVMPGSQAEKVTKGMYGLSERLQEYKNMGARFAKWRAVIVIGDGLPTQANLDQNSTDLANYALACQQVGLVPIVEPEVLMDGTHSLNDCRRVTTQTLKTVFLHLERNGVDYSGMLLKPNMVIDGKESETKSTPQQIAQATASVFRDNLPRELAGVVFLSGGQSPDEACVNLNAINQLDLEWPMSYSFGRALQDEALKTWSGQVQNVDEAQKMFYKRARLVSQARNGKFTK